MTVNADGHPVMKDFHAPNDEKRMVVILKDGEIDEWLTCSVDEARAFFRCYMGPLDTYPAPLPPRTKKGAEE